MTSTAKRVILEVAQRREFIYMQEQQSQLSQKSTIGIELAMLEAAEKAHQEHMKTHRTYKYPPFTETPCKECDARR